MRTLKYILLLSLFPVLLFGQVGEQKEGSSISKIELIKKAKDMDVWILSPKDLGWKAFEWHRLDPTQIAKFQEIFAKAEFSKEAGMFLTIDHGPESLDVRVQSLLAIKINNKVIGLRCAADLESKKCLVLTEIPEFNENEKIIKWKPGSNFDGVVLPILYKEMIDKLRITDKRRAEGGP